MLCTVGTRVSKEMSDDTFINPCAGAHIAGSVCVEVCGGVWRWCRGEIGRAHV